MATASQPPVNFFSATLEAPYTSISNTLYHIATLEPGEATGTYRRALDDASVRLARIRVELAELAQQLHETSKQQSDNTVMDVLIQVMKEPPQ